MTGIEALEKLRDGKKLRRIPWPNERFIYVEDGVVKKFWNFDGKPTTTINPSGITDLLKDDWELYNDWNRRS